MCYCLLLDWMNVNIGVQHCCLLGGRAQASSTVSGFGSRSGPREREAKAETVGKQNDATPTHHCYTICAQPQEGAQAAVGWRWGVDLLFQAHSGHSVCES